MIEFKLITENLLKSFIEKQYNYQLDEHDTVALSVDNFMLSGRHHDLYGTYYNETMVGFFIIVKESNFLSRVYIQKDHRRLGICSKLLNYFNIKELWTLGENKVANIVYTKNNFKKIQYTTTDSIKFYK